MAVEDVDYQLARIRFKKLYKKAKELNILDKDLQKLEVILKFKPKGHNIITSFLDLVFGLTLSIFILGFGIYGSVILNVLEARTLAGLTTFYTGANLETDQCLFPFSEYFLDFLRPPVDCSFCKEVSGFERVSNLSQSSFGQNYAYSGKPIIITDATKNWTSLTTFTFDFIKSIYKPDSPVFGDDDGSKGCQFFPYKTDFESLADVFKMSRKRAEMKGSPWYIGWSNCDPHAANILRQHYSRPYFLSSEMESSRTDWLFMGTPGYGAHMHIDSVQHSSWQAQIQGDKEWTLEPPPECYYECGGRFTDTVRAGEVVVLDTNRWFHGTNVVGKELSIVIGSEYD